MMFFFSLTVIIMSVSETFVCGSALMDCVGCEKCRLWGKLQVLGLGTSLQILLSVDDQGKLDPHVSIIYSIQIFNY